MDRGRLAFYSKEHALRTLTGFFGLLSVFVLVACLARGAFAAGPTSVPVQATSQQTTSSSEAWTFVSFPDFLNFDVPNPWPEWEPAIEWFFNQVKTEQPDFVLMAGDLVNGHWWDGPKCIEHMAAVYYGGWIRRVQTHGLKYYVAVGDHELGDDPWPAEKVALVPHFERAFARHLAMPDNGPPSKKSLAYYVLHKDTLIVTVATFEVVDGKMRVAVLGDQLEWLRHVFKSNANARHIIVQGHVPVIPPAKRRSSSGLVLEGGTKSAFWQILKEANVDLYLCGEHHAVNVAEADGVWQIVHGSSWGREVVDTQDYLICRVTPEGLELKLKSFPLESKGEYMWNLHKDRGPREIVQVPTHAKSTGPRVIGTLTIRKTPSGKQFTHRTGVFAEPTQAGNTPLPAQPAN